MGIDDLPCKVKLFTVILTFQRNLGTIRNDSTQISFKPFIFAVWVQVPYHHNHPLAPRFSLKGVSLPYIIYWCRVFFCKPFIFNIEYSEGGYTMATIPRTYLTTRKSNVDNITPVNGQVISVWDSDEVWYDVPSNGLPSGTPVRRKISGVRVVTSLPDAPMTDILYVYTPVDASLWDLRIWDGSDWAIVGNNSTDSKVLTSLVTNDRYYLTGSTSSSGGVESLVKNANVFVENGVINGTISSAVHSNTSDSATQAEYDVVSSGDPHKVNSYIHDVSRSSSTLTFTRGDGTTTSTTLPNTTYNVFNSSTAGLVDSPTAGHTQPSDSTNLLLTGSGWVNKSNIPIDAQKATKDGSNNTITSTYYANASISGSTLTLTKGDGTTTTTINIPNTSYSVFSQGVDGLVPGPVAADVGKFLKGDGTWSAVPVPNYTGAGASTAGTAGLVPPASAGQQNYYLKGDASWGTVFAQGSAGLVPAPTAADTTKFLKGDGTWSSSSDTKNTTGSENLASTQLYLVGATSQTSAGSVTKSNSNCYIYTDNKLYSYSTFDNASAQVVTVSDTQDLTNKTFNGSALGDAAFATTSPTLPSTGDNDNLPTNDAVRNYINTVKVTINSNLKGKLDTVDIAPLFDDTATYVVGEFCMYDDGTSVDLYQCKSAISTAGAWDATKWAKHIVSDYFSGVYAGSEHIVGNWIDGSALYEQTLTLSNLTASSAQTVAHSISVGKIFIHEGFVQYTKSSVTYYGVLSGYHTTANAEELHIKIDGTNITYVAGTDLAGATAYITVRYTKPAV